MQTQAEMDEDSLSKTMMTKKKRRKMKKAVVQCQSGMRAWLGPSIRLAP
jgi:hypothetical protein